MHYLNMLFVKTYSIAIKIESLKRVHKTKICKGKAVTDSIFDFFVPPLGHVSEYAVVYSIMPFYTICVCLGNNFFHASLFSCIFESVTAIPYNIIKNVIAVTKPKLFKGPIIFDDTPLTVMSLL